MKEHHIGIVVKSVEESQTVFKQLGYLPCSEVVEDRYQHNRILFMENGEKSRKIELIEAMDDFSTVKNFKPSFHHICYEIEDSNSFREEFRKMQIGKIFSPTFLAPAIENKYIIFAYLKNGLFIEFLLGDMKDAENLRTNNKNY